MVKITKLTLRAEVATGWDFSRNMSWFICMYHFKYLVNRMKHTFWHLSQSWHVLTVHNSYWPQGVVCIQSLENWTTFSHIWLEIFKLWSSKLHLANNRWRQVETHRHNLFPLKNNSFHYYHYTHILSGIAVFIRLQPINIK